MNSIDGGGGEHHQQINQCKVVEIVSSVPIATETQAYKIMKKFLEMDKAKLMDPSNILEFEDTQLVQRTQWNRLRRVAHEIPVKDPNGNLIQQDDRQDLVEPWLLADDFNDTELNAANDAAAAAAAAVEKERYNTRRFEGRYDIDDNDNVGDPMLSSPMMIGSSTTKKRSRSMSLEKENEEEDTVPPIIVAGGIKNEQSHDDGDGDGDGGRHKEKKRLKKEKKEAKKQAKKEKKEAKKQAKKEKKEAKKQAKKEKKLIKQEKS